MYIVDDLVHKKVRTKWVINKTFIRERYFILTIVL
jgi:hypothetical protein